MSGRMIGCFSVSDFVKNPTCSYARDGCETARASVGCETAIVGAGGPKENDGYEKGDGE